MKIDKEYSCNWMVEQLYLRDCGIKYEFVKKSPDGITIYKYKKTKKLFEALAKLYEELGVMK